jgi:hypothetical protein
MAGRLLAGAAAGPGPEGRPEAPVPVAVAAAVRLVLAEPVTPWVVVVVVAALAESLPPHFRAASAAWAWSRSSTDQRT